MRFLALLPMLLDIWTAIGAVVFDWLMGDEDE